MAISVFDLFKIGIGPSSSHTVGPMRAAALFVQGLRERGHLQQVRRVEVRLYGSLSATGVGHGSDSAVIMGLMGDWPDAIDPAQIAPRMATLHETGCLLLDGHFEVPFSWQRDMLLLDENLPYHPNAMTLIVEGESGELHRDTYYSIGGGFVVDAEQAASGVLDQDHTALPYDFSSAEELLQLCRTHNLRVWELMMANEKSWRSEAEIRQGLMRLWRALRECVDNGLKHEGILPRSLNVKHRAAQLHRSLQEVGHPVCLGSQRRKRRRRAHGHRSHQWRGRDHSGCTALLRALQPGGNRGGCVRLLSGRCRHRHFVQKERLDFWCRSGLPGRGRIRLRHGRCRPGRSAGCHAGATGKRRRDRPGTQPWPDLRPGGWAGAGAVHRAQCD